MLDWFGVMLRAAQDRPKYTGRPTTMTSLRRWRLGLGRVEAALLLKGDRWPARSNLTKDTFSQTSVRGTPRSMFFLAISGVLLAFVLIGFGPTFYLGPFRNAPSLPPYVLVHGAVLSAWYVWLVLQTTLVAANRVDMHRLFGVAGVLLGVAVVVSSLMTNLGAVPRLSALGSQVALIWRGRRPSSGVTSAISWRSDLLVGSRCCSTQAGSP